jgi:DNA-binding MarR family transcriptional regulator
VSRALSALEEAVTPTELRETLIQFAREFGLLSRERTPCGKDLPVSHAHALMYLSSAVGPVSQRDLCAKLGIDKSNVARLCAKLEQEGHIKQKRAQHDGRAVLLSLTPKGKTLAAQVESASWQRFERVLAELPARSHRRIIDTLVEVNEALRRIAAGSETP